MSEEEKETLLLVDDDVSSRRSLSLILNRSGYVVREAGTGGEALAAVGEVRPALALLDINLPDMGGMDVLTELRRSEPDMSIVMVTAFASVETAVSALNKGAEAYILKPLNIKDVLATLGQILEKQRLIRENKRLVRELQEELKVRRRAEAERDQLVKAVESAGESIVVADGRGVVRYVNPAFEQTTGFGAKEVIGQNHLKLIESDRRTDQFVERVEKALQEKGVWSGKLKSRRRDGEPFHEECTITRMKDDEGIPLYSVHVRRDVSERMKLEAVAEAVNTTNNIGYVFSGIRHELGNPINSIQMTLKMLRSRVSSLSSESLTQYLDRMLDELDRVRFLLQSLKSFNMYEAVETKDFDLRVFFDQFYALVRGDCAKRNVKMTTEVLPENLTVHADPRALQQVLLNGFTNALDACNEQDNSRIALRAFRRRAMVRIELHDNGVGMTAEEQANLFRPFVTSKAHGTGLGLVIAKKMMAQMKGSIEVKSERSTGTTIILTLPEGRSDSKR